MVDHQYRKRELLLLKPETKLLVERVEERKRSVWIRNRGLRALRPLWPLRRRVVVAAPNAEFS